MISPKMASSFVCNWLYLRKWCKERTGYQQPLRGLEAPLELSQFSLKKRSLLILHRQDTADMREPLGRFWRVYFLMPDLA